MVKGQTRTGVERHKEGPEGGTKGADGSEAGQRRIEHETEESANEGANRNSSPDPLNAGDDTPVTSERRDSVRERGPISEEGE